MLSMTQTYMLISLKLRSFNMSSKNKNSVNIFVFSKEVYHSLFKNKFIARDEVVYQYDPNKHLYKQVTNAFMKTYIRKSILNGLISIPEDFGENCVNAITENIKALLDFEDLKENQFFGCALKRNQYFFRSSEQILKLELQKITLPSLSMIQAQVSLPQKLFLTSLIIGQVVKHLLSF